MLPEHEGNISPEDLMGWGEGESGAEYTERGLTFTIPKHVQEDFLKRYEEERSHPNLNERIRAVASDKFLFGSHIKLDGYSWRSFYRIDYNLEPNVTFWKPDITVEDLLAEVPAHETHAALWSNHDGSFPHNIFANIDIIGEDWHIAFRDDSSFRNTAFGLSLRRVGHFLPELYFSKVIREDLAIDVIYDEENLLSVKGTRLGDSRIMGFWRGPLWEWRHSSVWDFVREQTHKFVAPENLEIGKDTLRIADDEDYLKIDIVNTPTGERDVYIQIPKKQDLEEMLDHKSEPVRRYVWEDQIIPDALRRDILCPPIDEDGLEVDLWKTVDYCELLGIKVERGSYDL